MADLLRALVVAALTAGGLLFLLRGAALTRALQIGRRERKRRRIPGDRGPLRFVGDEELVHVADEKWPIRWMEPTPTAPASPRRFAAYADLATARARRYTVAGELLLFFGGAVAGSGVAEVIGDWTSSATPTTYGGLPASMWQVLASEVAALVGVNFRLSTAPRWERVAAAYRRRAEPRTARVTPNTHTRRRSPLI